MEFHCFSRTGVSRGWHLASAKETRCSGPQLYLAAVVGAGRDRLLLLSLTS